MECNSQETVSCVYFIGSVCSSFGIRFPEKHTIILISLVILFKYNFGICPPAKATLFTSPGDSVQLG